MTLAEADVGSDKTGGSAPRITLDVLPWTSGRLGLGPGRARLSEPIRTGETLGELLARLAGRLPGFDEWVYDPTDRRVHEHCTLLVNGRAFEGLGGLDRALDPGDELTILPGFSGGQHGHRQLPSGSMVS